MQQLSGLDAAFVHQDSARTPMHICGVLIYDCGDNGQAAITLDQLQHLVDSRLSNYPLFRRKLHRVAMGMDTPYWVNAPDTDWDRHISEHSLPPGGDWQALHQHLSRLHGAKMNLRLPLWEIELVHNLIDLPGLPHRCQALVLKFHHSAIDGVSMAAIIDGLHRPPGNEPNTRKDSAGAPDQWALWTRAHINTVSRQFKLAETVSNLVPGFLRARKTRHKFSDLPAVHRGASRFNAPVKAGRHTGSMLMPMEDVVAIKRKVRRVTLNDIALACVAGALREYLLSLRRLPAKSLAAGVPINLREPKDDSAAGNKIATMVVGLATHVADPVERLRLIHRYAVAGKKQIDALGSGTIMDISDSVAPAVLAEGIRTMAWASRLAEVPVPFHTMVSNVPGPATPTYLEDARLVAPLGLGPVRDNMGLFHIVSNSDQTMSLSFSACRKLLPDVDQYQQCLLKAFVALKEGARGL